MTTPAPVLRPQQSDVVHAVMRDLNLGRHALIDQACGTGKTVIASDVAKRIVDAGFRAGTHDKVLVLANRVELVEQFAEALKVVGLRVRIMHGPSSALLARSSSHWDAVVATVQTMYNRLKDWRRDAFRLVIADEAHHSTSATWRTVFAHFATSTRLGLTATPNRMDGQSLSTTYDTVASRYPIERAVHDGYLVPSRVVRVEVSGLDLADVRTKTFRPATSTERAIVDLHPKDLAAAALARSAIDGVLAPVLELAGDRKTIVYSVNREHARQLADALNAKHPGCAMFVHGGTKDRADVLKTFTSGSVQFLVNCSLLVEGWNVPGVECVVLARPTLSQVFVTQAVGRALRLAEGKSQALIIDIHGVRCPHKVVEAEDVLKGAMTGPCEVLRSKRPVLGGHYRVVKMGPIRRIWRWLTR